MMYISDSQLWWFWPLGHSEMSGDVLVVLTQWEVLLASGGFMQWCPFPPGLFKRMIWSKISVTTRLRILGVGPYFHLVFLLLHEGLKISQSTFVATEFLQVFISEEVFIVPLFFSSTLTVLLSTLSILFYAVVASFSPLCTACIEKAAVISLFLYIYSCALFFRIFSITGFELFN